jgi:hypothetical protein
MANDLLQRLADSPVPPPPAEFDREVHRRLNSWLVLGQLLDLMFVGVPFVCVHFARAMMGVVVFSLTGRYETRRKEGSQEGP